MVYVSCALCVVRCSLCVVRCRLLVVVCRLLLGFLIAPYMCCCLFIVFVRCYFGLLL